MTVGLPDGGQRQQAEGRGGRSKDGLSRRRMADTWPSAGLREEV